MYALGEGIWAPQKKIGEGCRNRFRKPINTLQFQFPYPFPCPFPFDSSESLKPEPRKNSNVHFIFHVLARGSPVFLNPNSIFQ